ncbi:UDP-N-acetylmuramoylalanyl-D-glutamyl-2,6-diaminopimelate--D-alanyl-D-alanine ligase [bacterium AH-315-P15]|nr:UDP-N-acetylmuramoylalanyl-D-glutamyl-2,6-diaminopimelate--D-alanyl-D-alanine ligase [bacterium AH-315-P15]
MTGLWTAADAIKATGGMLAGANDWAAGGVSFDSREVQPGDLFVAIKGARDGHDFVADAFSKGAVAAVISAQPKNAPPGANLLAVPDTLEALERMGKARRAQVAGRICAVTGSAGKTGTKEALRQCLAPSGLVHASVKSFNNQLGVPLTLARMPRETEFGVFEIGMNHPGEILPLAKMVRPHVVIVTTVQPVHLEFFASVEEIADAKGEIFAGLEPGGIAIINRDSVHYDRLCAHARNAGALEIWGFGEDSSSDLRLCGLTVGTDGSTVSAEVLGHPISYKIGAPGRHLVMNSLAVMGAVKALGGDPALAGLEYAKLEAAEGRGRRYEVALELGVLTVVDESYNANPASMRAAIETLGASSPGAQGRRIAVLGDMLELGPEGPEYHAGLAQPLSEAEIDLVFCAGPLMAQLWNALPDAQRGLYAQRSSDFAEAVKAEARAGDVVMVKGSLGSNMKPIVEALLAQDQSTNKR